MGHDVSIGIICEERFERVDGRVYSPNQFGDPFWDRYARIIGNLTVVARVDQCAAAGTGAARLSHPRVTLREIPCFQGPFQLLPKLFRVPRALREAMRDVDGVIVRYPGTLSILALPSLLASGKPIAVEVVGDARAMFASGVGGMASGILQRLYARARKRLFAAASAITYVTDAYLQSAYPPPFHALTSAFSDVLLSDKDVRERPRSIGEFQADPARLLFVGTMEQNYKGIDTLLTALSLLRAKGRRIDLHIAGTGRLMAEVRCQTTRLGLEGCVTFLGQLSQADILTEMDHCHLFVLPSRTEGLPRSIIEAMARATPVLASAVGGIPELLPPQHLVATDDPKEFAIRISGCLDDPELLARMSSENLVAVRRFAGPSIERRRGAFYEQFLAIVRARTALSHPQTMNSSSAPPDS
jgi:glycosyltransferase involved in cell wall biosynthesis